MSPQINAIIRTYPIAFSQRLFNLLSDRLVPVHGEEDEGTLEALRRAGGLAVLDLRLLGRRSLLRQRREGRWHWRG